VINLGGGLSILVPFNCKDENHARFKNWTWLRKHWECVLPRAEIIIGKDRLSEEDPCIPFSKSSAINDAASRATGDIYVILDADGFINYWAILLCAYRIRKARKKDHKLWFVPYRQFYRLTERASHKLIDSKPCFPYKFLCPPDWCDIQNTSGSQHGHWYGAGIQILPSEAFWCVGGWDERFRGWGGEDHGAMRATDTLYWPHKTLPGQFLHVWHPMLRPTETGLNKDSWVDWRERVWENQTSAGNNIALSDRYYGATGHVKRMEKLVEEGKRFKKGLDKKKKPLYNSIVQWVKSKLFKQ